jgi:N-acetyl-gamma-glutamyl-phosphate reductase
MSKKIPVGLVGVTGYTGMELARILSRHPALELVRATSRAEAGKTLASIYPFLHGSPLGALEITPPDPAELARECRLVFLAVPHKTAMEIADALLAEGVKVVDLSADFPGCYPTSAILGLSPALAAGLVETKHIVIDSKSGTSGAGRKANVGTAFCEVHDSFRAYSLPRHRHAPEIEQELSLAAGEAMTVSFNTHLLPIDRGILSTIYTVLKDGADAARIREVYESRYADEPWVRVLPAGTLPETRWVRGTMYCDIGLVPDPRTGRLIILSAIDNLCRGASGQAVANANLMLGLARDAGLDLAPLMP